MNEIFSQQPWLLVFKVIVSFILGGIVGIDSEIKNKPAGLRTNVLIAGVSALLVSLGSTILKSYTEQSPSSILSADPLAIIQALIYGVSFLGAGIIFQRKGGEEKVSMTKYLANGASILFASAIGITVAIDHYLEAVIISVLVLVVNFTTNFLEKKFLSSEKS